MELDNRFLKNQNFQASSETFRRECESQGCQIPDVSGKVVLLPTEKRTYSIGNQTQPTQSTEGIKKESFILESCFQEHNTKVQQNKEKIYNHFESTDSDQLNKLETDYRRLKAKFIQLQEEHKKLIAVTAELTNALQLNIIGQTKNMHHVLDQCQTIYPTLFISKDVQRGSMFEIENMKKDVNITPQKDADVSCVNLSNEETVILEKVKLSTETTPNATRLNLNDSNQSDRGNTTPHCTPRSEKEIRDLVEFILSKVIEYLDNDEANLTNNCCKVGETCKDCRCEISNIVESVIEKVMESPRYKTSPRNSESKYCQEDNSFQLNQCHSTEKPFVVISHDPTSVSINDELNIDIENLEEEAIQITETNINQLKRDLLRVDVSKQILILRSLRWGLTKSDVNDRNILLETYIRSDLLDIHTEHILLEKLVSNEYTSLNEYTLRLLNTIASFRVGRKYLSTNDKLLKKVLLPELQKQNVKPVITDMLLAILQKLSLQAHCREDMVHAGLTEYLIQFLDEHFDQLSLYSLERSTALLMNLCLTKEAEEYCNRNVEKVVNLLRKFFSYQYTSCLPYINGILLSILIQEKVISEARKEKIDKVLQQLAKNVKDEYVHRQLSFLLKIRFSEQIESFIGDDDERPQKDEILEDELDTDIEVNEDQISLEEKISGHTAFHLSNLPKGISHKCHKETQYHNPYVDRGIYESNKMIKTPFSVTSGIKQRKVIRRLHNFPNSSFCYLEISQDMHDGTRTCRCNRCQPGKNRYSCGCYDIIRKELSEEIDQSKGESASSKYTEKDKKSSKQVENLDGTDKGKHCDICGEKKCDCAFESRPKIHRTPPET